MGKDRLETESKRVGEEEKDDEEFEEEVVGEMTAPEEVGMLAQRRKPANGGGTVEPSERRKEVVVETANGWWSERMKTIGAALVLLTLFGLLFRSSSSSGLSSLEFSAVKPLSQKELDVASWNIAAINNNPFEYWLTLDNELYYQVMNSVQEFIETPGAADVKVKDIFMQKMMDDLVAEMRKMDNFDESAIKETIKLWQNDFSKRKIISGFLQDHTLGKKRLTSMPDRVTNTISLKNGQSAFRPTVINCFSEPLNSVEMWWDAWKDFMFSKEIDTVKAGLVKPAGMLDIIPRAKYPLLSAKEEKMSIPLQTLCCAIFDAILVHMLTTIDAKFLPSRALKGLSSSSSSSSSSATNGMRPGWQTLRKDICTALNLRKNDRVLEILTTQYTTMDIICLQEVAGSFINRLKADSKMSAQFHIVAPGRRSKSDQNSVVLLSKKYFPSGVTEDITARLKFEDPKAIASGDVTLIRATDAFGRDYVIGSFHGDTNGLSSIPLVKAVARVVQPKEELILGLDANTYRHGSEGKKQDVLEFGKAYTALGLDSCWGPVPNPHELTTYNARTFLQPQLNKASSREEIEEKGDTNPKDFILFKKGSFIPLRPKKDNTGRGKYIEKMVFPTLDFPSDHGILSTKLKVGRL